MNSYSLCLLHIEKVEWMILSLSNLKNYIHEVFSSLLKNETCLILTIEKRARALLKYCKWYWSMAKRGEKASLIILGTDTNASLFERSDIFWNSFKWRACSFLIFFALWDWNQVSFHLRQNSQLSQSYVTF